MSEQNPQLPIIFEAPKAEESYGATHQEAALKFQNQQDAAHFSDGDLFREPLPATTPESRHLERIISLPEPVSQTHISEQHETIHPPVSKNRLHRFGNFITRLTGTHKPAKLL